MPTDAAAAGNNATAPMLVTVLVALSAALAGSYIVHQNAIGELRAELGSMQTVVAVLESQAAGSKQDAADRREHVVRLEAELGPLKAELGGLRAELGSMQTVVAVLKSQASDSKEGTADLRTQVDRLHVDLGALKTDLASPKLSPSRVVELPPAKDALLDNLRGAVLDNADLAGMDLKGVDRKGASLRGTKFSGALNLKGAVLDNLRGAVLDNEDLVSVDLQGVDLKGASLRGTKFGGALNLKDAVLDNLRGAVLDNADLSGVDLSGVDLQGVDLTGVRGLQSITLGTGGKHTANVIGCTPTFPKGTEWNLRAGKVVVHDGVLTKITRRYGNSDWWYYTQQDGSESYVHYSDFAVPP